MKLIKITSKTGQYMESPQADAESGLALILSDGSWGKPERWALHKDEPMAEAYDEADVLEVRIVEDMPAIDEVMDDTGAIVQYAIPARTHKEVKLRAQYLVVIEDISAKVQQEKDNAEALAYLAETDWMIIREVDAGVPCPVDVKAKRAEARAKIVR